MNRKINRVGKNTLTISLPSKWAKEHGLKAGDELALSVDGSIVTINAKGVLPTKSITLNLNEQLYKPVKSHQHFARTLLGNAYKAGYDEITVLFEDKKLLGEIQRVTAMLIGMEIIRSSDKSCTIKRILNENPEEFYPIMKKFQQIIINYSKELFEVIQKNEEILFENTENFRFSIEKLSDFMIRLIIKSTNMTALEMVQYRVLVRAFEKLGREYIHLSNYAMDNKIKPSSKTIEYLNKVNNMFYQFFEHYYNFKIEDGYKLANLKNELIYKEGYELLQTAPRKEAPLAYHLVNIARRTWDMEGPLIALRIK